MKSACEIYFDDVLSNFIQNVFFAPTHPLSKL